MKFEEFVSEWKVKCRLRISASWKACQDQILRDHIFPYIGCLDLRSIVPADISTVMEASKAKQHSPNQQKKIYMVMSKIFSDAVQFFEYREKNPVKKRFHLPEITPLNRPYLDYEQAVIFLEYVMNNPSYGVACWIMTLAGPRISEIQSLEWADIDWEENEIRITKSYSEWTHTHRPYTKNKGWYTVPMCTMLREYLLPKRKPSGLVCGSGGKIISRWGLGSYLRGVSKALNLPVQSSHGLRHTCARIFVERGASNEEIAELLGHKSLASTKTYTHRKKTGKLKKISSEIA